MNAFNWKPEWWIDGMSMYCLAHIFCRANKLSLPQFRRFFDQERKLTSNTTYPLDYDRSQLDLELLLKGIDVKMDRAPLLFPSHFYVAKDWGEVCSRLKYCPVCIQQGIHLSLHQIAWIEECPVHNETLVRACHCAPTNYSLTHKYSDDEGLCRCGQLRFGAYEPFSEYQCATLVKHYRAIEKLQLALPHGVDQYRVSTDEVDRAEYRDQVSLATKVFRFLLGDVPRNADLSKLRREPVKICRADFTRSRVERFRQFCKCAMRHADDSGEDWTAALIGRLVEQEYFGDEGMAEMRFAIQRNGCSHGLRKEDIPILKEIFSIRLLECIARGARPVRSSLHPDLRLAMRMVGEPLCQITWRKGSNGCKIEGTAYWLDDDEEWPKGEWGWIDSFATHVVRNWNDYGSDKYRIEELERTLSQPAFIRLFEDRDAQLTQSGCRQMRLLD